jgi:hypothetical protein
MHVRSLAALIALAALAAGCGQAVGGAGSGGGGGGSQPPPPSTQPGTVEISGVLVATKSQQSGGQPQPGVEIGVFSRPFSTAGPLMADPPKPIATVRTDADGRFAIELPGTRSRYFVSAIDARGYAPGRWARPGAPVRLTACTDCAIPL